MYIVSNATERLHDKEQMVVVYMILDQLNFRGRWGWFCCCMCVDVFASEHQVRSDVNANG